MRILAVSPSTSTTAARLLGRLSLGSVPRRWWLLFVLLPGIAFAAHAYMTAAYEDEATERSELSLYREYAGVTGFESYIASLVATDPRSLSAQAAPLARLGRQASTALAQVRGIERHDPEDAVRVSTLEHMNAAFQRSVGRLVAMAAASTPVQVAAFHVGRVVPSFTIAHGTAERAIAQQLISANSSGSAARLSAWLAYGIGSLVIIAVLLRFAFVQRREVRKHADDAISATRRELQTIVDQKIEQLADHDSLTGLFNRGRLMGELAGQLHRAARARRSGALLLLDIDKLKVTNDTYGHATGDQQLVTVAHVLRDRMRQSDTLARLGSDEFAVVLPDVTEEQALAIAAQIQSLLTEAQVGPPIGTSVGIGMFDGVGDITPDDLLVATDIALYEAKEQGGGKVAVYRGRSSAALRWVQRIRTALDEDRFILYGQPIVELRTGKVSHHELLIRMIGEDGDVIPPASFIPTAERFGLINEIDRWVTRQALAFALAGQPVTVNLSAHSISDPAIVACVHDAIARGLDPANVMFEITETAMMRNTADARLLAGTLTDIGCDLALDDFGTGFGSFTYLKHFPARYLKIDMEFVRHVSDDATDQHIIESISGIAHALRKHTIAEGVEDADTLEVLREREVDYAQGYLIGRPAPMTLPDGAAPRILPESPRALRGQLQTGQRPSLHEQAGSLAPSFDGCH
jgi:diguanylate cyclase (GGDEF)-like protein